MKTTIKNDAKHLLFTRKNYVLLAIACFLIVLGLILMSGNGSSFTHFEADIFSFRRIVLAPIISLTGYLLVIVAILCTEKNMK